MRRRAWWVAILAVGCAGPGADPSADPVPAPPPSPGVADRAPVPCALLTADEISAALGTSAIGVQEESGSGSERVCAWADPVTGEVRLRIALRWPASMPSHADLVDELGLEGDAEVVEGLGDLAIHANGTLYVWAEDVALQLIAPTLGDPAALERLAALALTRVEPR